MPAGLLVHSRLGVVDDGDKPISILSKVENHVPIDIIGILKHMANFCKVVPSNTFDYCRPRSDLARRIGIALHRFAQMPSGNDVHYPSYLTDCEVANVKRQAILRGGGV